VVEKAGEYCNATTKEFGCCRTTNMPAVLVETGFITNKEEEDYLNSESGQKEVVRSIANAVIKYKQMIDGKSQ